MEGCYRSTPKFVGAFLDAIYQNPTTLLLALAGVLVIGAYWWRKTGSNIE